ncbi:hypothetical protein GTN30_09345 [Macrococcoides canis]|uniref:Uncharacterized protein n=1 Tax=Macrococcoides canis TaxID=1855823 RepID=A0AAE7C0H7_9STAP|nr:hypothetical protein [Macrococcus canis]QIH78881.1 hypothetical protein GTN30_09345 [Macrococcus canis]
MGNNQGVYDKLMNLFLILGIINFFNLILVSNVTVKLIVTYSILVMCIVSGMIAWIYVKRNDIP